MVSFSFFFFFCSHLFLGEWLLSEHAQFMSVPVEMNLAAIQTLFHVFQTHMRFLSSLKKLFSAGNTAQTAEQENFHVE